MVAYLHIYSLLLLELYVIVFYYLFFYFSRARARIVVIQTECPAPSTPPTPNACKCLIFNGYFRCMGCWRGKFALHPICTLGVEGVGHSACMATIYAREIFAAGSAGFAIQLE